MVMNDDTKEKERVREEERVVIQFSGGCVSLLKNKWKQRRKLTLVNKKLREVVYSQWYKNASLVLGLEICETMSIGYVSY